MQHHLDACIMLQQHGLWSSGGALETSECAEYSSQIHIWQREIWSHYICAKKSARTSTSIPGKWLCAGIISAELVSTMLCHELWSSIEGEANGSRASTFAISGPTVWNALPVVLWDPEILLKSFQKILKAHFFVIFLSTAKAQLYELTCNNDIVSGSLIFLMSTLGTLTVVHYWCQ